MRGVYAVWGFAVVGIVGLLSILLLGIVWIASSDPSGGRWTYAVTRVPLSADGPWVRCVVQSNAETRERIGQGCYLEESE